MNKPISRKRMNSSPQLQTNQFIFPQITKNQLDQTNIYSPIQTQQSLSHSGSSRILQLCKSPLNKFYSFKKIRESKVRQKNDQGKVIMQVKLQNKIIPQVCERINDLNQARTISSKYSPRQSNNSSIILQESYIIERGPQIFQKKVDPGFQRNKILKKIYHPQLDLIFATDLGWICHFQVINFPISNKLITLLGSIPNEFLLTFYAQKLIYNNKYLLMYQPYQVELQKYIRRKQDLSFEQIIKFLIQIISQLIIFRQYNFYPKIDIQNVVLTSDKIKMKIYQNRQNSSQKDLLIDTGIIGHDIVNILRGNSPIKNFTKLRKNRFNNLMKDLINGYELSLEDAFVKINVLQDF